MVLGDVSGWPRAIDIGSAAHFVAMPPDRDDNPVRDFTVLLVNARHVKNVSGRKSDVLDCQWP